MLGDQFKKILQLAKKTGDRVVVFDASFPQDSFVVTDIERYLGQAVDIKISPVLEEKREIVIEKVVSEENLTEEDLTDKINREISMWKNQNNESVVSDEDKPKKAWSIPSQVKDKAQEVK